MSVLIKGMTMPKCCEDCPLGEESDSLYYSCYPQGWDYIHDSKSGRMPNCPLIEVPKHGRLIDADAFVEEKQEWYCKQNCGRRKGIKNGKECFIYKIGEAPCRACEIDDLISAVDDAPTIIEKEDGT